MPAAIAFLQGVLTGWSCTGPSLATALRLWGLFVFLVLSFAGIGNTWRGSNMWFLFITGLISAHMLVPAIKVNTIIAMFTRTTVTGTDLYAIGCFFLAGVLLRFWAEVRCRTIDLIANKNAKLWPKSRRRLTR